ncbi:ubx domain protein [Lichtheimia corymbifera JMRC:FSU:9682]|uniref:Ubx domain protein n=1 Tax=Lichtheimia corymbifera JMRC:FSU:9682 TaxID=1263082 RepID=A0A068S508_9FUNG|nr:ubx domain protein [Lichtheimia corymbifera JMRC:FSU:9682]
MDSLDRLDNDQKDLLNQFQAITQSDDLETSISRLEHYNWNLERAVESVYDANNSHDAEREKLEQEVASSAQSTSNSRSSPLETDPLTRSSSSSSTPPPIPPASHRRQRPRFSILSLLTWPFGVAWNITWAILSFASRILSRPSIANSSSSSNRATSTQQRQDPRTVAARFLREFELKYGETHIDFFQGGYSQALEIARRDLRFLLVVLQSDEHDDTDAFCRQTLTSNELIDYLQQKNVLVWGGNVRESEAFQVSSTLQATMYPFMAIIALQSSNNSSSRAMKMSVVDRVEGLTDVSTIIRRFDTMIQRYGGAINRLRMERDQRDMERRLREEQDRAYLESLKADQEKERQAREAREEAARAEEAAKLAEEERLQQAEKRQQYIHYLCRTLTPEPDSSYGGKVAKLSFRLADGERVIRKFKDEDTLETLYKFVEAYPLVKAKEDVSDAELPSNYTHKYNFTIISPYPRTVYEPSASKMVSEEKGLWPSATLIVDADVIDDEDDE